MDDLTPLSVLSASSRFSNTESCSNTVGFWNLRPMPSWAICGSLNRSRSIVLPKKTLPESGRVLPVMMSIIVVLPAPLGPMMQRSSPGAISSDKLLMALKPSKLTLTSSKYKIRPWVMSTSVEVTRRPKPALRPPDSVLPVSFFCSWASRKRAPASINSGVISELPNVPCRFLHFPQPVFHLTSMRVARQQSPSLFSPAQQRRLANTASPQ